MKFYELLHKVLSPAEEAGKHKLDLGSPAVSEQLLAATEPLCCTRRGLALLQVLGHSTESASPSRPGPASEPACQGVREAVRRAGRATAREVDAFGGAPVDRCVRRVLLRRLRRKSCMPKSDPRAAAQGVRLSVSSANLFSNLGQAVGGSRRRGSARTRSSEPSGRMAA